MGLVIVLGSMVCIAIFFAILLHLDERDKAKTESKPLGVKQLPKHLEREARRLVAAALVKAEVGLYMDAPPIPVAELVALAWSGGQSIFPWVYQEDRISPRGLAASALSKWAIPLENGEYEDADEALEQKFYAYALGHVIKSFPKHTEHFDRYPGDEHIYHASLEILRIATEKNADEMQELLADV